MRAYLFCFCFGFCLSLALAAASCGLPSETDVAVRWKNYEVFVSEVQPIVAAKCGNPSCHGNLNRPFSIYSRGNWRERPRELYLGGPLSEAELTHNFNDACVLLSDASSPAATLLLRKPLGLGADTYHGGGAVFPDTTDRSYRVLLDWVGADWNQQ